VLVGIQFLKELCMQINRLYYSITVGVPDSSSGEISTNIDRHPTDRLRMAVYGFGSTRGRQAISTYR
jgi:23S rRNA-/tRNA-specific pseudouridylate synthase